MRIGEIFGQLDVRCLNLVDFYKASNIVNCINKRSFGRIF